jgi:hypothetical protein
MEAEITRMKISKAEPSARPKSAKNCTINCQIGSCARKENVTYLSALCGNRPDDRPHHPRPLPEMETCFYEGETITVLTFILWGFPPSYLFLPCGLFDAFLKQYPTIDAEEVLSVRPILKFCCVARITVELTDAGAKAFEAQANYWIWPSGFSSGARLHKRKNQSGATPTANACCVQGCNIPLEPLSVETVCSELPLAERAPAQDFHSESTVHGPSLLTATVCAISSVTAACTISLTALCPPPPAEVNQVENDRRHHSPAPAHIFNSERTVHGPPHLPAATARAFSSVTATCPLSSSAAQGRTFPGGEHGSVVRRKRKWVLPTTGMLYCTIWLLRSDTPYRFLWLPFAILSSALTKVRMNGRGWGQPGWGQPRVVSSAPNEAWSSWRR